MKTKNWSFFGTYAWTLAINNDHEISLNERQHRNPVMKLHTFQLMCPKLENKIHHRRTPNLREINPSG
jgi:hypothetical protein